MIERMAEWLTERLEHDAVRVMDESQADVAVFSYESEDFEARCNALSSAGCTVFVLAPETKGALAQRIIRAGGKTITFRQLEDAILVLQRLTEALVSPPVPDKKEVVAIYSAKQAGGSFVAWNLWAVLTKLGEKVSLCSVSDEASPFRAWIPEAPVCFGSYEGREEDDIWIVDASGSSEAINVEADLALVVHDADPSKKTPVISGKTMANRIWSDEGISDLYIPDLGRLAVLAMHSHQAATELDEGVFRLFVGLWRYWHGEAIDTTPEPNPGGKSESTLKPEELDTPDGRHDSALTRLDDRTDDRSPENAQDSGIVVQEGAVRQAFSFDENDPPSNEGRRFQFND